MEVPFTEKAIAASDIVYWKGVFLPAQIPLPYHPDSSGRCRYQLYTIRQQALKPVLLGNGTPFMFGTMPWDKDPRATIDDSRLIPPLPLSKRQEPTEE